MTERGLRARTRESVPSQRGHHPALAARRAGSRQACDRPTGASKFPMLEPRNRTRRRPDAARRFGSTFAPPRREQARFVGRPCASRPSTCPRRPTAEAPACSSASVDTSTRVRPGRPCWNPRWARASELVAACRGRARRAVVRWAEGSDHLRGVAVQEGAFSAARFTEYQGQAADRFEELRSEGVVEPARRERLGGAGPSDRSAPAWMNAVLRVATSIGFVPMAGT